MTPAHDLVSLEYDQHKAEVLRTVASKLSSSGIRPSESDLEASYNEAWHALYLALADGEDVENRVGWLVTVTYRRAINEFRALKVSRRVDVESLDSVGVELDLDSKLDAEIQLRQVREGFRASLSKRELEAATLCHLYGFSRPEAAKAMGVRPKRMEKIMDRASGKISSVVETVRAGEHCGELESTIRAFALGLLEPGGEKYELATDHLDHCPACRREVWTERGLAAIGPPLPVAFALLVGGAGAGGGIAAGIALKGGGKGAAVAGGGVKPGAASAGASTGRKAALAGGAVAAAAVVVAAAALATGTIGGDGDAGESGGGSSLASAGGGSGSSASADSAAAAARAKAAKARAARKAALLARKRAAAKKRRAARAAAAAQAAAEAEAAAAAAQAAETAYVPEPVYTPPPEPSTEDDGTPEETNPGKQGNGSDPGKEPGKGDQQGDGGKQDPPAETKPTTDAGEEFGLR